MNANEAFWTHLDQLVATSRLVVDRPRGSVHPRYPDRVYPLDYGYLAGTTAGDGGGIDVWVGARGPDGPPDGILCTVDLLKRDAEIKILLGCTPDDQASLLRFTRGDTMQALLVRREP
jgi:inorganic pyrophosphatase